MAALRRIKAEMNSHGEELSSHGITAGPADGDLFKWTATILGPPDTAYAGGTFRLSITFSEEYPFRPPEVKFLTKIFHPHVCTKRGKICANLFDVSEKCKLCIWKENLKNVPTWQKEWSPGYTILGILLSIISFLSDLHLMEWYNERTAVIAKKWTEKYAVKSSKTVAKQVMDERDDDEWPSFTRSLLKVYSLSTTFNKLSTTIDYNFSILYSLHLHTHTNLMHVLYVYSSHL